MYILEGADTSLAFAVTSSNMERERESHRCYLQPSIDSSGDPWSKLYAVYNNGITGVGSFNN